MIGERMLSYASRGGYAKIKPKKVRLGRGYLVSRAGAHIPETDWFSDAGNRASAFLRFCWQRTR